MKTEQVTCDYCGRDLTYTSNSDSYRLVLNNQRIPIDPEITQITDMMMTPPIKKTAHFCWLECLKGWVAAQK
jgi:hypothetical protein